jgi:alpha-beta hydrolase superfamily lysophospholipase
VLARVKKWLRRIGFTIGIIIATVLLVRSYDAWRSPPLKLWHTKVPHELDAKQIDDADWGIWIAAENSVFAEMQHDVIDALPEEDRIPINRYFGGSPINPLNFPQNWNHSYALTPEGKPRGAVVLVHGLTDSPYSMRHIAQGYVEHGFVAVAMRMPGHGTVPAGLTTARWESWLAATRLAVRTARKLAGDDVPLHLVGYSNGGALTLKYTLDSLSDPTLARPDRLVLLSPMVGITSFAKFAGVLGWPAAFPSFAKAAWLDVLPEYNPFKYNSFPVNAARQSSQVVGALQDEFIRASESGALAKLPPILTFQSVLDSTVSTTAVVQSLYANLPANGSELVLFDINRRAGVGPIIKPAQANALAAMLPPTPRNYIVTIVGNAADDPATDEARTVAAGSSDAQVVTLGAVYPNDLYSLSHIALPFPLQDGLYGSVPNSDENFGVKLGQVAVRGERGALIVGAESLMRASSNPFYDYQLQKLMATLPQ